MIDYKLAPIMPPRIAEVQYLPSVEEIRDKQAQLPASYLEQLRNPNSKFNNNITVNCAFIACPHPASASFDLRINIEGSKWWALKPNYETDLPGYWKKSPTGRYYSQKDLWLSHVGHAEDADGLIGQDNLYTVNTTGLKAAEDYDFCRGTQEIIREHVKAHRDHGVSFVDKVVTLPSDTTRITNVVTATVATVATVASVVAVAAALL